MTRITQRINIVKGQQQNYYFRRSYEHHRCLSAKTERATCRMNLSEAEGTVMGKPWVSVTDIENRDPGWLALNPHLG
jgi:hypothetical protein